MYALLLLSLLLPSLVWGVEDLTLTSPIVRSATARWRVEVFTFDRSAPRVSVTFMEPTTGERQICVVEGAGATTLISTLNTANLTANSLQKRAITWAQGTGCLAAGSIAGTPE